MANNELNIILKLKDQLSQGVDKAGDSLKGFGGKMQGLNQAITGAGSKLASFIGNFKGIIAVGAAVGAAIFKIGKSSLETAAKFETINTQFKVLTGSAETAKLLLKDLSDFSARTPFQFEDIANAGKQLIAFGIETSEVKDRLREIGDVAAATGADFKEVTTIFGQIQAAGKLTGERFLQLQERAIPIGPAIAKTLGVAEKEVRGLISAGKVTTEVFNEAFATLSEEGGVAFNGMGELSETLAGRISTLKDNISLLSNDIGQLLLPVAKAVVSAFTRLVQGARAMGGTFLDIIKKAISPLTEAIKAVISIIQSIAVILKPVSNLILFAFFAIIKVVSELLGGLGQLIKVGLAPVVALFKVLAFLVESTRQVIQGLVKWVIDWAMSFKFVNDVVTGTINLVQNFKNSVIDAFNSARIAVNNSIISMLERIQKMADVLNKLPGVNIDVTDSIRNLEEINKGITSTAGLYKEKSKEITEAERAKQEELAAIREEYRQLEKEIEEAETEAELEKIEEKLEQTQLTEQMLFDIRQAMRERETQMIAAEYAKQGKFLQAFLAQKAKWNEEDAKGFETWQQYMVGATKSKNKEVAAIAKALAIYDIGVKTYQAAMGAYNSLVGIPFVGPVLGAAAAGAAIAYGNEQVQAVQSQSVPALAEGGVVPAQSGGKIVQVAEAGQDEAIIPLDEAEDRIGGGGDLNLRINIDGRAILESTIENYNEAKKTGTLEVDFQ